MNATCYLNVSDSHVQEIKQATEEDSVLQEIIATLISGWLKLATISKHNDVSDSLLVYDGIVYKGEKIVIPQSISYHAAPLGRNSMIRRTGKRSNIPARDAERSSKLLSKSKFGNETLEPKGDSYIACTSRPALGESWCRNLKQWLLGDRLFTYCHKSVSVWGSGCYSSSVF